MQTDLRRFTWFAAALLLAGCQRESLRIPIAAKTDEQAVVAIRDSRGTLVRTLLPGSGRVEWDALDEAGTRVPPGAYTASVFAHRGFTARASGSVGHWPGVPFPRREIPPGMPTGVVADDQRIYLAWSGGVIAACDLDGRLIWTATLPADAGCAALAIDGNQLIALALDTGPGEIAESLVRLTCTDGQPIPWPAGPTLPIASLWPADAKDRPLWAGSLAAGHGRIYLSFPELHFLAVLDSQSGAYLQTIVGPAPTALDVVATRTPSPQEPGVTMEADFAVVALGAGAIGKVLFAHDPLWVIGSDIQRLDAGEQITALALLGDRSPHFPRSIFTALGPPHSQIQRREILDAEGYVWLAGQPGGRAARGPWLREAFGSVRAIALAANGRLWVAETNPGRFSEWSTEGNQGRLLREFFGPFDAADRGVALLPGRPDIVVAAGSEWRFGEDGAVECLGVINGEGMSEAGFFPADRGASGLWVKERGGKISSFERRGDGDYEPQPEPANRSTPPPPTRIPLAGSAAALLVEPLPGAGWRVSLENGPELGTAQLPADGDGERAAISATTTRDGRVFGATIANGIRRFEITGLDSVRAVATEKLRVAAPR